MRALIADDHPLYREAVRSRLERLMPGVDVVEVGTLSDLMNLREAQSNPFKLILLDLRMPGMSGGDTVREVAQAFPHSPVVLMSGSAGSEDVKRAIEVGARGFLPKTLASELFSAAVSMIVAGGTFLPTEVLQSSGAMTAEPARDRRLAELLTPREQQVLVHLAAGASNKEIARDLKIAEVTVKLHVRQILRKIQARNRAEAASIAARTGFI